MAQEVWHFRHEQKIFGHQKFLWQLKKIIKFWGIRHLEFKIFLGELPQTPPAKCNPPFLYPGYVPEWPVDPRRKVLNPWTGRLVDEELLRPGRRDVDVQSLYLFAKSGTGDQLKAELERQNFAGSVDDIRLLGTSENVEFGDLNGPNHGKNLLHIACSHGNASTAKALLELGASPEERTPIVRKQARAACRRLNHGYYGGETCMHLAADAQSGDVINLISDLWHKQHHWSLRKLVNARTTGRRIALELLATRNTLLDKAAKGESYQLLLAQYLVHDFAMGPVRLRLHSHHFATQSSHFVNRPGYKPKWLPLNFCYMT